MSIHALQFALELIVPPEPAQWDRFMDTLAMATDLLPLIIAVLPGDGCGPLPVGTQLLVMGAALLATGQRILVLMTDLIPHWIGVLISLAVLLFKLARGRGKKTAQSKKKEVEASLNEDRGQGRR
jgi:hypothetical protein